MIVVRNGVVTGLSAGQQKVEGSVSLAGQLLLHHVTATRDNKPDNKTAKYRGSLRTDSGSGTFYIDNKCKGTITISRQ